MNDYLCTCERPVTRTRSETVKNRCNTCGNIIIQFPPELTGNIECEPVYENIESDNSYSESEFDHIEECECGENQAGERCDFCLSQTKQKENNVIDTEQTKTLLDQRDSVNEGSLARYATVHNITKIDSKTPTNQLRGNENYYRPTQDNNERAGKENEQTTDIYRAETHMRDFTVKRNCLNTNNFLNSNTIPTINENDTRAQGGLRNLQDNRFHDTQIRDFPEMPGTDWRREGIGLNEINNYIQPRYEFPNIQNIPINTGGNNYQVRYAPFLISAEQNDITGIRLKPPRFEAKKDNVRRFFSKFEKYMAQFSRCSEKQKVTVLANLLCEKSLYFFDYLEEEVKASYENVKRELIEHYEDNKPLTKQWEEAAARKQKPGESVTEYYDDLLRLGERLQLPGDQMLFFFMNGLPEATKNHISLSSERPTTAREALRMAKLHQSVVQPGQDTRKPIISAIRNSNSSKIEELREDMKKLSEQMAKLCSNQIENEGNQKNFRKNNYNSDKWQETRDIQPRFYDNYMSYTNNYGGQRRTNNDRFNNYNNYRDFRQNNNRNQNFRERPYNNIHQREQKGPFSTTVQENKTPKQARK